MSNELVINTRPKSNISEDIRTIRTNLQFTSADKDSKTLLITSSAPGEGKSFISSNLACAFAQNGEKTLLVDCDLRQGRLHKIFEVSNEAGLSYLLTTKEIKNRTKYLKQTDVENLYVITRGDIVPNPSELLNSNRIQELIEDFKNRFDRIIFDGVPINGLPDSLIMAKLVDRVAIVCCVGETKIDELEETKKALEKIDANIAGVIVNKVERKKRGKYSSYYE